jgi:transcriptional regulator with XRE-family HTH domain
MQQFKERLISRRNALGWSQIDLASKSGVSERAIAGYESQGNVPSGKILEKLSSAMSVTPSWLIGGEESVFIRDQAAPIVPERNSPYSWMEVSTLEKALIDLSQRLPKSTPQERKHILGNIADVLAILEAKELSSKSPSSAGVLLDAAAELENGDPSRSQKP